MYHSVFASIIIFTLLLHTSHAVNTKTVNGSIPTDKASNLPKLPDEIWAKIFSFLPLKEQLRLYKETNNCLKRTFSIQYTVIKTITGQPDGHPLTSKQRSASYEPYLQDGETEPELLEIIIKDMQVNLEVNDKQSLYELYLDRKKVKSRVIEIILQDNEKKLSDEYTSKLYVMFLKTATLPSRNFRLMVDLSNTTSIPAALLLNHWEQKTVLFNAVMQNIQKYFLGQNKQDVYNACAQRRGFAHKDKERPQPNQLTKEYEFYYASYLEQKNLERKWFQKILKYMQENAAFPDKKEIYSMYLKSNNTEDKYVRIILEDAKTIANTITKTLIYCDYLESNTSKPEFVELILQDSLRTLKYDERCVLYLSYLMNKNADETIIENYRMRQLTKTYRG